MGRGKYIILGLVSVIGTWIAYLKFDAMPEVMGSVVIGAGVALALYALMGILKL